MTSHDLVRLLLGLMGDFYSFLAGLEVRLIIFRAATDDLCQGEESLRENVPTENRAGRCQEQVTLV